MCRQPISFAKLKKLHLLASAHPKPGKAPAEAASRAMPFQGVGLVTGRGAGSDVQRRAISLITCDLNKKALMTYPF